MNFVSLAFILFFLAVFVIYWQLSRPRQNLFLLFASYVFYGWWDWRFLSLILTSTAIDFYSGRRMDRSENPSTRRFWLSLSIGANLLILGYFKYSGFFISNLVMGLNHLGCSLRSNELNIILPVGISFYTFQSMSYSIDIYRRELKPCRSFLDFATFVAFFPQLVAGPIVRAKEFLFQLESKRSFQSSRFEAGMWSFILGLFKKAFIADLLAIHIVDPVFAEPALYSSAAMWLALFSYSIQIYCDFSGYSQMAIGCAAMLGFSLPENFRFPYLATSFSGFWRCWHMTMSRFFRDYVFIPLGGSRQGTARTYSNLLLTALISGLWHGANWTFVLWGWIHGLGNVWGSFRRCADPGVPNRPGWWRWLTGWFVTQLVVLLAWVVFRATDITHAGVMYHRLFILQSGSDLVVTGAVVWAIPAFLVEHACGAFVARRPYTLSPFSRVLLGACCAAMIFVVFHTRPETLTPFIYFQF